MKLGYVIHYVADVAATVAFYEAAFGLERRFVDERGLYAEMATGETALAFAHSSMAGMNGLEVRHSSRDAVAPGVEIALVSDDPAVAYDRAVAAGALPVAAPKAKPWGQLVAYVRDIDGLLVEICSPMAG